MSSNFLWALGPGAGCVGCVGLEPVKMHYPYPAEFALCTFVVCIEFELHHSEGPLEKFRHELICKTKKQLIEYFLPSILHDDVIDVLKFSLYHPKISSGAPSSALYEPSSNPSFYDYPYVVNTTWVNLKRPFDISPGEVFFLLDRPQFQYYDYNTVLDNTHSHLLGVMCQDPKLKARVGLCTMKDLDTSSYWYFDDSGRTLRNRSACVKISVGIAELYGSPPINLKGYENDGSNFITRCCMNTELLPTKDESVRSILLYGIAECAGVPVLEQILESHGFLRSSGASGEGEGKYQRLDVMGSMNAKNHMWPSEFAYIVCSTPDCRDEILGKWNDSVVTVFSKIIKGLKWESCTELLNAYLVEEMYNNVHVDELCNP
jgi:hypothetical protein